MRCTRGGAVALLFFALLATRGMTHDNPPPPRVGSGDGSQAPALPRTEAEARAAYEETAIKCRRLGVAAVRDECLREAQRNLQRDLARLHAGSGAGG